MFDIYVFSFLFKGIYTIYFTLSYRFKHTISFHPDRIDAQRFENMVNNNPEIDIHAVYVDGDMSSLVRRNTVDEAVAHANSLTTNVRCMSTGIDEPRYDSVLFTHLKTSVVGIIQALSRALRKLAGKERAYIIVPIYKEKDGSTDFKLMLNIINSLASQDERLAAKITNLGKKKKERNSYGAEEPLIIIENQSNLKISNDEIRDEILFASDVYRQNKSPKTVNEIVERILGLYDYRPLPDEYTSSEFTELVGASHKGAHDIAKNEGLSGFSELLNIAFPKDIPKNIDELKQRIREVYDERPSYKECNSKLFTEKVLICYSVALDIAKDAGYKGMRDLLDEIFPESVVKTIDINVLAERLEQEYEERPSREEYNSTNFRKKVGATRQTMTELIKKSVEYKGIKDFFDSVFVKKEIEYLGQKIKKHYKEKPDSKETRTEKFTTDTGYSATKATTLVKKGSYKSLGDFLNQLYQ